MNYQKFNLILNRHIFDDEKKELLRKIADKPERFIGLFRPTKPKVKVLQHILQSHEIKFGDAFEEIIENLLSEWGFIVKEKIIIPNPANPRRTLDIDHYFSVKRSNYFIEQKVRDDHDSTKKKGQIDNFEAKLEFLYNRHRQNLIGIIYFIDPDFIKNKNYYLDELQSMKETYGTELYLFYGKELFEYFQKIQIWDDILHWLKIWKDNLAELPEINFDMNPQESFRYIKDLEIRYWRKIMKNEKLWNEGIMGAIFRNGKVFNLLVRYFEKINDKPFQELSILLKNLLKKYY
jgi:hypothetical protein